MKPTPDDLYSRYVYNCIHLWGTEPATREDYEHQLATVNGFGGVFSGGTHSFLIGTKKA